MKRIVMTTVAAMALMGAGAAGAQTTNYQGWGGAGPTPDPAPTSGAGGEEFGYAPRDYNGSIDPNRSKITAPVPGGGAVNTPRVGEPTRIQSGSTGNATTAPSAGTSGGERVIARLEGVPDFDQRMGPTQTQLALRQTALLNTLASLERIEAVRNLRRDGELYHADALSRGGGWMSVELDPYAGTITVTGR